MNIKVFTKEARNYRADPEGSSDTWPRGKPKAAPHGHDMLFESSALELEALTSTLSILPLRDEENYERLFFRGLASPARYR
ncbi:MAG: hypothetical protein R3F28_18625 [Candidatus Kapaibacterium sp.]